MRKKKGIERQEQYAKQYAKSFWVINEMKKKYSIPKIYIPKGIDKKPTVTKQWYVYYYYTNPYTGKRNRQPIKVWKGINEFKTVKERKEYGEKLVALVLTVLESGWSPYANDEKKVKGKKAEVLSLIDALELAFTNKIPDWKGKTITDNKNKKDIFIEWIKKKNYDLLTLNELSRNIFAEFLNEVAANTSNRNANNFKSAISTLLTKLVDDGVLTENILLNMKKRTTKASKHKPFTREELKVIKEYLLEHDKNLYHFMCFVGYGFLRNVEVCRLRSKSFNFEDWTMSVETKTDVFETVRIIEPLKPIIQDLGITGKGDMFAFTTTGLMGEWDIKEENKVTYFGKRFLKIKETLGLDDDHTIYSMRHTFAVNIYNGHRQRGLTDREAILKMLPVTRHANESGLRNYLRSVNAFVAKDYTSDISIDF